MSSFSQQAVLGWYGLYDYLMGTDERPVTVSLIGDSGSAFSLMSLPGSFKEVRHLIPADMLLETMQRASRVPARIALKMPFLRPKRYYQHITIPTLVFVGTEDNVTLPVATVQNVIATPRLDMKAYECGHYGLLHGELFPAAMADCIDFLKRHLVPSSD
ncbi:hypothetical protein PHSY_005432 [Pseudozyma hubeiensis SY62]|uniref:Alpha/beta hydrolase n=1 Tax=Pseudozyma hubeiensis (strain SY62) TaxID=1305764 RepID=R9P938_PSEHS|nr:hypothetical protein PHSY_005432 [Pseudozyma hubeiensis SY62]GAC97844.1 hypothetical protein PHSY_005432 [Pseudozyma hubeiensis SY62]